MGWWWRLRRRVRAVLGLAPEPDFADYLGDRVAERITAESRRLAREWRELVAPEVEWARRREAQLRRKAYTRAAALGDVDAPSTDARLFG